MTDPAPRIRASALIPDEDRNAGATLFAERVTLRVAEAGVRDVGHTVARLAPADLVRIGARPGGVLRIAGRMAALDPGGLEVGRDHLLAALATSRSSAGQPDTERSRS